MNGHAFKLLHGRFFGRIGFGHDGDTKAQFGGLFQALLSARGGAHFTGQAHFTKSDETLGQRFAPQRRGDGQHHRQIGGRLADPHATHGVDKHVLIHAGHTGVAMQYRQQHGEAVFVQADAQAPGRRPAAVNQRLDLHQHGARAFQRDHHAAARYRLGVLAQKDGTGVADPLEAFFSHGEHADFIHRTKAVLDGPHQPEAAVRVAFKIKNRIDHVLQHTRASQRAFFGDVADQHDGGATGFCRAREVGSAFAHLRHRTGRAGELLGIHGLDRVNDCNVVPLVGLGRLQGGQDFFKLDFSQHIDLGARQAQALGAQRDLCATFFARYVQGFLAAALQRIQGLQQQGGFANAGVTTDQHHPALDDSTAQDTVQFVLPRGGAVHVTGFDVAEGRHLGGFGQRCKAVLGRRTVVGHRFDQRVPGCTSRALAQPLGAGATAFGAGVDGFFFGHDVILLDKYPVN